MAKKAERTDDGKISIFNLGARGVNVVDDDLHMVDGDLRVAQNVMANPEQGRGGIAKRFGHDLFVDLGAAAIINILNVQLLAPPQTNPETGEPEVPGDPMYARCTKSVNQSIANNTLVTASFDTEGFDVGGLHDPVSNNSRFTIPAGGKGLYIVIGQSSWQGRNAAGGRVGVFIYKNGSERLFMQEETPDASSGDGNLGTSIQCVGMVVLDVGDYVEMKVQQNSGGALNLLGADPSLTSFTIARFIDLT